LADFVTSVNVLNELLLHGVGESQLLIFLLVLLYVDAVVLGEISELVHDAGHVADQPSHMMLQFIVVVEFSLPSNTGLGHYIVHIWAAGGPLVSLSHLPGMNLVVDLVWVVWLESESR